MIYDPIALSNNLATTIINVSTKPCILNLKPLLFLTVFLVNEQIIPSTANINEI